MVTSLSVTDRREVVFDVKQAPSGTIKDVLLASAFFPAFKNEKLGGKTYLDGGMVNNVPVDVLAERGYKNLIVIQDLRHRRGNGTADGAAGGRECIQDRSQEKSGRDPGVREKEDQTEHDPGIF